MLNGNRAQMGCQLAMTSGFTNLFIGRQRNNRLFESLQSGISRIGNTFANLGAVAQTCQTPLLLVPAKRHSPKLTVGLRNFLLVICSPTSSCRPCLL